MLRKSDLPKRGGRCSTRRSPSRCTSRMKRVLSAKNEPLWRTAAKLGSPYANGDRADDDDSRRRKRRVAAMIN